jgi:hypothetical protein
MVVPNDLLRDFSRRQHIHVAGGRKKTLAKGLWATPKWTTRTVRRQ